LPIFHTSKKLFYFNYLYGIYELYIILYDFNRAMQEKREKNRPKMKKSYLGDFLSSSEYKGD